MSKINYVVLRYDLIKRLKVNKNDIDDIKSSLSEAGFLSVQEQELE